MLFHWISIFSLKAQRICECEPLKCKVLTSPRGGYYSRHCVITRNRRSNEDTMTESCVIETLQGTKIEAKNGLKQTTVRLYHTCLILCPQPSLPSPIFLPPSKALLVCFDCQEFSWQMICDTQKLLILALETIAHGNKHWPSGKTQDHLWATVIWAKNKETAQISVYPSPWYQIQWGFTLRFILYVSLL